MRGVHVSSGHGCETHVDASVTAIPRTATHLDEQHNHVGGQFRLNRFQPRRRGCPRFQVWVRPRRLDRPFALLLRSAGRSGVLLRASCTGCATTSQLKHHSLVVRGGLSAEEPQPQGESGNREGNVRHSGATQRIVQSSQPQQSGAHRGARAPAASGPC